MPSRRRSARLFGARAAATVRYVGAAGGAEIVGGWERDGRLDAAPLGALVPVQGGAIARVAQTGRTARIDLENEPPDLQEHMVEGGELGRGGSDRGLRATLGRHLDHDRRLRAFPARRRDSPREVHQSRRGRACERGGSEQLAGAGARSRPPSAASRSRLRPRMIPSGSSTPSRRRSAGCSARDAAATVRYLDDGDSAEIVGGWERDGRIEAPLGVRLPVRGRRDRTRRSRRAAQRGSTWRRSLRTSRSTWLLPRSAREWRHRSWSLGGSGAARRSRSTAPGVSHPTPRLGSRSSRTSSRSRSRTRRPASS